MTDENANDIFRRDRNENNSNVTDGENEKEDHSDLTSTIFIKPFTMHPPTK